MFSAFFVLVLSGVMVVSGRKLMHQDRHSKIEGILSCAVGIGLALSWYSSAPSDFSDLADFVMSLPSRLSASNGPFSYAAIVVVPAALAMVLLLLVYRFERKDANVVKNIFGPLGRIRRPRFLR